MSSTAKNFKGNQVTIQNRDAGWNNICGRPYPMSPLPLILYLDIPSPRLSQTKGPI